MTKKGTPGRTLYVRITENGKRRYEDVGMIFQSGKIVIEVEGMTKVIHITGMPNPGWWD